jgi:XTP/dITP diphosphohydrolase
MAKNKAAETDTREGRDRRQTDRRTVAGSGDPARRKAPADVLLVATTNPHKLKEIARALAGLPVVLKTLKDFPEVKVAEETGSTFAENARQKALHYAKATGALTMAEDSGFEVDVLNREPGIYSARYLRPDASYPERFKAIYDAARKRQGKPDTSAARFVCALALVSDGKIVFETIGVVEGELAAKPAGRGGFGYDPIFCYPPYGKTFAEVTPEEKLAVSHRGEAIRALKAHLEQNLQQQAAEPDATRPQDPGRAHGPGTQARESQAVRREP